MMTVFVGPIIAEIDHGAGVGVAAAGCVVRPLSAARGGPVASAPVDVIGAARHQAVTVRVQILAKHADVMSARNDVEQVLDDAVGDEHLAIIIEIQAPGVGGAPGEHLERFLDRVKAPDTTVEGNAVSFAVPGRPMYDVA